MSATQDLKASAKWLAQSTILNAYGTGIQLARHVVPRLDHRPDVKWLLIGTFPNGGSTAVASFLAQSASVTRLTSNGEGQWLRPDMSAPGKRWRPDHKVNYDLMRQVWLSRVASNGDSRIIVEKSPPNICRMDKIIKALAPMPVRLLLISRDPFATCASWNKRYGRNILTRTWGPELKGKIDRDEDYFCALGRLYGERARMLVALEARADARIAYETFTEAPETLINTAARLYPELSDIEGTAAVAVKDYEAQPLQNMNARQINLLTADQLGFIRNGLRPFEPAIAALGYSTDLPG